VNIISRQNCNRTVEATYNFFDNGEDKLTQETRTVGFRLPILRKDLQLLWLCSSQLSYLLGRSTNRLDMHSTSALDWVGAWSWILARMERWIGSDGLDGADSKEILEESENLRREPLIVCLWWRMKLNIWRKVWSGWRQCGCCPREILVQRPWRRLWVLHWHHRRR
jgi:hypothetical protein